MTPAKSSFERTVRKPEGTEIRPFLSILFVVVDRNNPTLFSPYAITRCHNLMKGMARLWKCFATPLMIICGYIWDSMDFHGMSMFFIMMLVILYML